MQTDTLNQFNRLYQEAVLDAYLFFDLSEVRILIDAWLEQYKQ